MPPLDSALTRPGIVGIMQYGKHRLPVGTCARCGRVKPLHGRDLCIGCRDVLSDAGELGDYGWVKADRMRDYAIFRGRGQDIKQAAASAHITARTGYRYESELAAAGCAPWRATDPNVLKWSRSRHIRNGA